MRDLYPLVPQEFPTDRILSPSELQVAGATFRSLFERLKADPRLAVARMIPAWEASLEIPHTEGYKISICASEYVEPTPDDILLEVAVNPIDSQGYGHGVLYYRVGQSGFVRRFDGSDAVGIPSEIDAIYPDTSGMTTHQRLELWDELGRQLKVGADNQEFERYMGANDQPVDAQEIASLAALLGIQL